MTNENCSYTHVNGTYINLYCTSGSTFCCQATDSKFCSTSECSSDNSSSFALSAIVFWGILGGLLLISIVIMVTVYVFCYSRNPGNCLARNPLDELLEIPGQKPNAATNTSNIQASQTTSSPAVNSPDVNRTFSRNNHLSDVVIRNMQETRTICVTPGSNSPDEPYSASLDHVRLVANDRRKKISRMKNFESSPSPRVASRHLHITSIASVK